MYVVVDRNPYLIFGILLLMVFGVSGCRTLPAGKVAQGLSDKEKKTQSGEQKQALPAAGALQIPIGIIHMVDQAGKFVLIKSTRSANLDPDTQIIAYGPDARMSSHLKVSPARKGIYLTADLVDGMPAVGDMVMMVQTIHKPSPDATGPDGEAQSNIQVLE